jgi:alkylation response protein AidB-like acyl-CoA dehydrogenase
MWNQLPLLFVILLSAASLAAKPPIAVQNVPVGAGLDHPSSALSVLQQAHARDNNSLVLQSELDFLIPEDGGGACASAAGVNLMQTLRVMAGLDRLSNPHRAALAAFANQPELLKGRVTNASFVKLIEFYQRQLGWALLAVEVLSAPNSSHAGAGRKWSTDGPDLTVAPREIKVLSYTVTRDGKELGRHFVLLKESKKNEITVVDPWNPVKDRRYVVEHRAGQSGEPERVFLLQPAGMPQRLDIYELNTIFKVTIRRDDGTVTRRTDSATSVDYIKRKFDETATTLRGTKQFLSPRVWRERTASFGLPGLDLPAEYGGAGWPAAKVLEVFRHAGEHNLNFRDVVGGAHVRPLLKSTHPKVLEIVRQVAEGKGYIAIAITEPGAGSDVPSIKSTSRKVDGGFLITGTKRFNARLDQASHVIIFTQGTTGRQGKLSVFVVPIGAPGLYVERLTAHGLTGNSYGGVSFTDLFVPDSHLVGTDGEGLRIFYEHFLYWRLMQSAAALGTGQNALKQMADRIKTREAFGAPIGRFTHLQQPIGQYTTQLNMAYSLAKEAAELIDQGDYPKAYATICGLKAEGVEVALSAVDAAMRAFGGEGYSTLVDLGDRLRDLQGLRIADGTTDVMRMEVVRRMFGEEFWKMAVKPGD